MMAVQRSPAIPVGNDELQLFEHMLKNKFVNYQLDTIIAEFSIIRLKWPEDIGKTPGLRLAMGGWRSGEYGINLDKEGHVGDKVTKVILVDGYMEWNQKLIYDGVRYEGSENGLPIMAQILYRMVSDNQKYSTDEMPDINFDMITPISELWFANYNNNPDFQAFQIGFEVQYEKVHTDIEV